MKKIFFPFIVIMLVLFSCEKSSEIESSDDIINSNTLSGKAIQETKKTMAEILSEVDYKNLDWHNATVSYQGSNNSETLVTVSDIKNKERILLYLINKNAKTYMWNNEVHSIDIHLNKDGSYSRIKEAR